MINKVTWVSQEVAENLNGTEDKILISICNPNLITNIENHRWTDILALQFDDATPEARVSDIFFGRENVLFDNSHANEIVTFIKRHHESKIQRELFVHCYAGLSRSTAVSKTCIEYLQLQQEHPAKFNPHVYKILHANFRHA